MTNNVGRMDKDDKVWNYGRMKGQEIPEVKISSGR